MEPSLADKTTTEQDMVEATDLAGFAGAPFPDETVAAAVDAIRTECEWHIAPARRETFTIRTGGSDTIVLRTLKVQEVEAVSDGVDPARVRDLGDGVLYLPGGWPCVVTITVQHGYYQCPSALLALIAERARAAATGRIKQESLAGRSVVLEGGFDPASDAVLSRYMLGGRV